MHFPKPVVAASVLAAACLVGCESLEETEPRVPSSSGASSPTTERGWILSGGGRAAYAVRKDPEQLGAVVLEPAGETEGKYGTWMRQIDAGPYHGKRVRISASVRTEGTTRRADFWARAQGPHSPADGRGLGGQWQKLPANSEWSPYTIVLDVDPRAERIEYGVGIAGPGRLWIDQTTVELMGEASAGVEGFPEEERIGDWLKTDVGAPDYAVSADGDAVRVEPTTDSKRYVALVHAVPAAPFTGRRVNTSFEVRTEGIEGGSCVAKVQRTPKLQYQGFLAGGTTSAPSLSPGFTRCDIAVDVAPEAGWILYGFTYRGAGKAWVRGGRIDAVAPSGPATPTPRSTERAL